VEPGVSLPVCWLDATARRMALKELLPDSLDWLVETTTSLDDGMVVLMHQNDLKPTYSDMEVLDNAEHEFTPESGRDVRTEAGLRLSPLMLARRIVDLRKAIRDHESGRRLRIVLYSGDSSSRDREDMHAAACHLFAKAAPTILLVPEMIERSADAHALRQHLLGVFEGEHGRATSADGWHRRQRSDLAVMLLLAADALLWLALPGLMPGLVMSSAGVAQRDRLRAALGASGQALIAELYRIVRISPPSRPDHDVAGGMWDSIRGADGVADASEAINRYISSNGTGRSFAEARAARWEAAGLLFRASVGLPG
jgi:hypothetical protein